MAWTVVAAEVTAVGDWHASQVSAHAENDEPFWVLSALVVVLSIAKCSDCHRLFGGDFLGGAMTNEERLSAPLEGDVLAFGDVGELDFDLGQGEDIS